MECYKNVLLVLSFICGLVYFSIGIVLAVYTTDYSGEYDQIEESQGLFDNIIQKSKQNFITDIQIVKGNQSCPEGYDIDMFEYSYKGTTFGCQCNDSYEYGIIREDCCKPGERDYWTTKTEYYTETDEDGNQYTEERQVDVPPDCTCFGEDIQQVKGKTFNEFQTYNPTTESQENIRGCAKVLKNYNFQNKYPKYDEQKDQYYCDSNNEKVCGGDYNGICFPKLEGCPIFKVQYSNTEPESFVELEYELRQTEDYLPYQFYFLRQYKDQDPIIDFQASQGDKLCTNGNNYDEGRKSYILEKEQRSPCLHTQSDFNQKIQFSIDEKEFFQINDQNYLDELNNLPEWEPFNDNYDIDIFQKTIKGIHVQCRYLVKQYEEYDELVQLYIDEAYSIHVTIGFVIFFTMIQSAVLCPIIGGLFTNEQFLIGYIIIIICLIIKQTIFQPLFWSYYNSFNEEKVQLINFLELAQKSICPKADKVKELEETFYEVEFQVERIKDWFTYISIFWPENLLIGFTIIIGLVFLMIMGIKSCNQRVQTSINNQKSQKNNIKQQKQYQIELEPKQMQQEEQLQDNIQQNVQKPINPMI